VTVLFDSLDGRTPITQRYESVKLEAYLGECSVLFSNVQGAVETILELLESHIHNTTVVLPVTTPTYILSGVIRAGAQPLLLDISPATLQMDPDELSLILADLDASVVILDRPGGQPVDPKLLAACVETTTIVNSELPPHKGVTCEGTFTIYNAASLIGTGAVVFHKYTDQVKELKSLRSGFMGKACEMSDLVAGRLLDIYRLDPNLNNRRVIQATQAHRLIDLLSTTVSIPFTNSNDWPYLVIESANADRVVAYLHTNNVQTRKLLYPLHLLPVLEKSWIEHPTYPNVESLHTKLLALPTNASTLNSENLIVSLLKECL
jgi:dTDP-4-amino-4,6-dideoxygalactose transaminase